MEVTGSEEYSVGEAERKADMVCSTQSPSPLPASTKKNFFVNYTHTISFMSEQFFSFMVFWFQVFLSLAGIGARNKEGAEEKNGHSKKLNRRAAMSETQNLVQLQLRMQSLYQYLHRFKP